MITLLGKILSQLDVMALSLDGDNEFEMLNPAKDWFLAMHPDAKKHKKLDLQGCSLFLDNFLVDAQEYWQSSQLDDELPILKSGFFVEQITPALSYPLEASALRINQKRILLITHLGDDYQKERQLYQVARETVLTREQLELEVSKRTIEIQKREREVAVRLISAAGFRDEETGAHIRRIGLYAVVLARALGWSEYAIVDIATAAPMHDLGKIGIPDGILQKPAKLSAEEFTVMKDHPAIGREILNHSSIPMIQMAAEIAGAHHEYWNGRGYPKGLKGDEIPQAAQIVAIVDVYDALVHKRVYKPAIPEDESIAIMRKLVGTQFNPIVFEVFIENLDEIRTIREANQD